MTNDEKKRLSAVLRATEYLFLENIALKLVLEHCEVKNWQKLLDHLRSDKEMMAGAGLKFSDLYRKIERSEDPSAVLKGFLSDLPSARKPHCVLTMVVGLIAIPGQRILPRRFQTRRSIVYSSGSSTQNNSKELESNV